ncbi:MAG: patatin-like phospholipase family protein [Siphonobacter sp.]
MKKILVLAGGSVKGAFQAGAIKATFESGFRPDAVYGISAGAMNATFLVNELGKLSLHKGEPEYHQAAEQLCEFWKCRINTPDSLAYRRGTYELGMSAFRRNFEGLLDTTPLRELLYETVSIENLQNAGVGLKVGAVDVMDGRIVYADPYFPHFFDYVLASSAIPILMPVVKIGNNDKLPYLDGGLREVAPIRRAILDGAEEIICIACHPKEMDGQAFEYGNLLALVDRVMDIAVNETLNNDLDWAQLINDMAPKDGTPIQYGPLKGKRRMKLTIIRPQAPLAVDIQNFTAEDIGRLIIVGYQRGKEILSGEGMLI